MEKITIVAGVFSNGNLRFWKVGENYTYPQIGDYAIVQNNESYDLVKVIAIISTTEELAKQYFTNNRMLKIAVKNAYLDEEDMEDDSEKETKE